jgi:hypothetical protein
MKHQFAAAALALALAAPAAGAHAAVYTDDLAKCIVNSSTPADQTKLVVWLFSAISVHPAVKAYANFTPAQREAIAQDAAGLMQRLLTSDCRAQTVAALKYEGLDSIGPAFGVLGQVAMRGLMTDPQVAAGLQGLGDRMDAAKLRAVGKEAGLPDGAIPAAR